MFGHDSYTHGFTPEDAEAEGEGSKVRSPDYANNQPTIHARQRPFEPALCGATSGPWTNERVSFVTCAACRAEIRRRVAERRR